MIKTNMDSLDVWVTAGSYESRSDPAKRTLT